jgi:DNA-binding Xre family transcriptional regulator
MISRRRHTPSQARSAHRLEFVDFSGASTFAKDIVQCVRKLQHLALRKTARSRDNQMFQVCEGNRLVELLKTGERHVHPRFFLTQLTQGEQLLRLIVPARSRRSEVDSDDHLGGTMYSSTTRKPDPIDGVISAKITARRKARGVSQQALAEKIGVSFQQIQKYESGENRVAASRLIRIARALGCQVTDLIPDEDR